jgi:pyruvate/2-oxoglutarate dehydrogenase complex dihydrolipoamide acyltransferase (E2) component
MSTIDDDDVNDDVDAAAAAEDDDAEDEVVDADAAAEEEEDGEEEEEEEEASVEADDDDDDDDLASPLASRLAADADATLGSRATTCSGRRPPNIALASAPRTSNSRTISNWRDPRENNTTSTC